MLNASPKTKTLHDRRSYEMLLTVPPSSVVFEVKQRHCRWHAAGDARLPWSLHRPSCAEMSKNRAGGRGLGRRARTKTQGRKVVPDRHRVQEDSWEDGREVSQEDGQEDGDEGAWT
ncbi:hypothetical protein CRENBAI_016774 [Crenichthys baileyi]|uniref:Uncharacterized protein n=1 Tax=Crenichthys baileyi TaxID=28760 RepID=A0AAV9SP84_9TELE